MKTYQILFSIMFAFSFSYLNGQSRNYPKVPNLNIKNSSTKAVEGLSLIQLSKGECYTSEDDLELCFDGLLEDSRCPPGAQCFWAGNAKLALKLKLSDGRVVGFELNTNRRFNKDTTLEQSYLLLERLSQKGSSPSKATVLMSDLGKLESNARILGFREANGCGHGWQIEMTEDTIISNSHLIKDLLGDKVEYPIQVYIELGIKKRGCHTNEDFKNHHLDRIVLTKVE